MNINLFHVTGLFLYPPEYKQTLTGIDVGRNFNFIECVFIMQKSWQKALSLQNYQISWTLNHFMPLVSFYTAWTHQKTRGFLMFSGG